MSTPHEAEASDPLSIIPQAAISRLDAADADNVLRALSSRLLSLGAVTESFESAVLAREQKYPTGLPTRIPTAIPHTDPEHVIRPGLAIATLAHPVPFGEMGASERTVSAHLVVMLVLADAHSQLAALQNLVARLQDDHAVEQVLRAPDDTGLERTAADWLRG